MAGFFKGKFCKIQINNKTIIEFGSRRIRGIIKASVCVICDITNRGLNNSSYPTRPHSIIVYCVQCLWPNGDFALFII